MKTLRFTSKLMGLAILALAFTSIASAQATRTWVSGVGDDANPCSRTAPCKTFAGAISKTAVGGEIDCLDEGGFGQVTITKAITIDCDSGPGGVLAGAGSGILVNAGTGVVTLRSININGIAGATDGVKIIAAGTVHVVDMNIYNCSGSGINVATGASTVVIVEDTRIHDCGSGITTNTTAGLITADYSHVSIWGATNGVNAQNGTRAQIHNSTIVGTSVGVNQSGLAALGSVVTVFNCNFTGNGTAVQSIAGASSGVSGCVLSTNGNGLNPNGGSIASSGNNVVLGGPPGLANGGALTTI